ncbi:MAG: hypothetical protein C5B58_05110 [Acidobacteria bacterium]|nr:MAG: hypothetical protein C5B58_05110 [Acidobacteriota bacterium]
MAESGFHILVYAAAAPPIWASDRVDRCVTNKYRTRDEAVAAERLRAFLRYRYVTTTELAHRLGVDTERLKLV